MGKAKDKVTMEQAARLVLAREHLGLKDATAGAAYLTAALRRHKKDVNRDTYTQHENGHRAITRVARYYAEGYGVNPEWLLLGANPPAWLEGSERPIRSRLPFQRPPPGFVPLVGFVGANPDGSILFNSGQESGDMVKVGGAVSGNAYALEVRGHSMPGLADDGSIIYFEEQHQQPTPDMVGSFVACELDTGEVLVKRLARARSGAYVLESINGPTIKNPTFRWIAEVTDVSLPKKAARIIRRGAFAA